MKGLFGVAVLAAVVLLASAYHLELCKKDDQTLKGLLKCQRDHATAELKTKIDRADRQLQCDSEFCSVRKLCAQPNFETALKRFFTESEIEELYEIANHCDRDSHVHHH
ncbi:antimicrobial peptide microplusin-like [Ornithodoros turicata]|uniref:antimicrobial peptide microplusin-like n=1 Tax=Ornithodoros turicata TaxID=34597 RepID=UPI003139EE6C